MVEVVVVRSLARKPIAEQLRLLRGFYAIVGGRQGELARRLVDPARGGARALQLRIKPEDGVSTGDFLSDARQLAAVARACGALFVVNDRVDVAVACGADGVHLGQRDLPLPDARALVEAAGADMLIGISTHDLVQVRAAIAGGADYLGFGPVFPTGTKADADPVRGLGLLAEAVKVAEGTPVVAIGGITPARSADVAATGCAAACSIAAVNRASDPVSAAREIGRCWIGR